MPRRSGVTYSLVRKRIRPSINKTNIYNAATWNKSANRNTQFRQVFFAKQETRSYHGEHLTETQLRNVFKPENTSVNPLQRRKQAEDEIPHAMQTFTALERRLDFALFRSLFACSVRQAAQCIVGGAVKVNGVRISSPSYELQAGDIFSVDPQRVLEAMGRVKPSSQQSIELTNRMIRKYNQYLAKCHANPEKMWSRREGLKYRHGVHSARQASRNAAKVQDHNNAVKREMNQKLLELKPQATLVQVLSGSPVVESPLIRDGAQKIINFARSEEFALSQSANAETISEQELDADKSPMDPLDDDKKASFELNPETISEQDLDADRSPVDPLSDSEKASHVNASAPQTPSEQDVDADNSPVDPLADSDKASRVNNPRTAAEEDVDADNSPVDPLKHKDSVQAKTDSEDVVKGEHEEDPLPSHKKAGTSDIEPTDSEQVVDSERAEDPLKHKKNVQAKTDSEDVVKGEHEEDPLPTHKKASTSDIQQPTDSEQVVDGEHAEDPLPSHKKAQSYKNAFSLAEARIIAAKYVNKQAKSFREVNRLVDDLIKESRLVLRNKYTARMVDPSAPAPYDPSWVERLPEAVQEVAADMPQEELASLRIALPWSTTGKLYGLSDPSKRWFTPWTPRQFVAPMAVLPHHIEIDFETCHAVYLRDPVSRPNHSEVISPFSLEMHERAHMWYISRRRKNLSRL